MTFQKFTMTYFGAMKSDKTPYVFPADINLVQAQTGLERQQIVDWLLIWDEIQTAWVKNLNRMPTALEIVHEYEVDHGIVSSTPSPSAPVPDRTPDAAKRTPFFNAFQSRPLSDPEDALIGSLTVRQFRALLDEILDTAIVQPAAQEDPNAAARAKLEAALAALK